MERREREGGEAVMPKPSEVSGCEFVSYLVIDVFFCNGAVFGRRNEAFAAAAMAGVWSWVPAIQRLI